MQSGTDISTLHTHQKVQVAAGILPKHDQMPLDLPSVLGELPLTLLLQTLQPSKTFPILVVASDCVLSLLITRPYPCILSQKS